MGGGIASVAVAILILQVGSRRLSYEYVSLACIGDHPCRRAFKVSDSVRMVALLGLALHIGQLYHNHRDHHHHPCTVHHDDLPSS